MPQRSQHPRARSIAVLIVLATILPAVSGAMAAEKDSQDETKPKIQLETKSQATGAQTGANAVMGTGVPREPQRFTREHRLLDAARRGDRATVERALELGVSVTSADDLGRSAFLLAVRDAKDMELVEVLHKRGGAIDRADAMNRTPLSYSAGAGELSLSRYLVGNGAEIDRLDKQGRTPLFHAVLGNQLESTRYLIERGAKLDVQDQFLDTPLMMACAKGYSEMAGLLLARGADASLRNQEGRSAGDRAAKGLDLCRSSKKEN